MDLFRRPEASEKTADDPVFWIEEVRLLKSFSPDTKEQIREPITFQKGLNIIWAPAPPMHQRKEINFAGHAAGKTTLCRLLRYLLGEHNTAAPEVKDAIEENFRDGWIVGKIHILEKTWIVARPLHHATRPRARCIQSDSIDELLSNPETHLSFDAFQNDLAAATIAPLRPDLRPHHRASHCKTQLPAHHHHHHQSPRRIPKTTLPQTQTRQRHLRRKALQTRPLAPRHLIRDNHHGSTLEDNSRLAALS